MTTHPPIAVFAYNRPRHLELCLESLKKSMEACGGNFQVFIFCDFPRKESDREGCAQVTEVAKKFQGATPVFREQNFGFKNITEGISQLCAQFGKAIVIEDDVLVARGFLSYMTKAMEKYENERSVFMVSGFMYHGMEKYLHETFFLRSPFIWGWGVWKRSWSHFTWECAGWEKFLKEKKEIQEFDFFGSIPFSKNLEKTMKGLWNTWDAQWMYSHFCRGGLALYPAKSLVWNCGVGGGVHGVASKDLDPKHSDRELYLHGDERLEQFLLRECVGIDFPMKIVCDTRAMRHLALIFLRERVRKEKKKWRLYLQTTFLYTKAMLSQITLRKRGR